MRTIGRADPGAVAAFVEVAERASFRGAAKALRVPRSTLSERVAALERELGVQLLVRTTRSVKLTDLGARFHREVAPAIAALADAQRGLLEARDRPTGRLRVTAPLELGQRVLADVLPRFAVRHPEVVLDVELTNRRVQIVEEGFDVAIRVGPLSESSLVARRLGTPTTMRIYGSPDYLRRAGAPRSPAELAGHRCLVMTGAQSPDVWLLRVGRKTVGVPVTPHVAINSFDVLTKLVLAGVGLGRLPEVGARAGVASGALREVLAEHAPAGAPVFAVHPHRRAPAAVRAFLALLVERFEKAAWDPIA
jgi:DNA-binding transcriptional LysR family regulator